MQPSGSTANPLPEPEANFAFSQNFGHKNLHDVNSFTAARLTSLQPAASDTSLFEFWMSCPFGNYPSADAGLPGTNQLFLNLIVLIWYRVLFLL